MAEKKKSTKKSKSNQNAQEKKPPEDFIIVNSLEEWLKRPIDDSFADKAFLRILLFFVLHSPCKKGSYSRYDLEQYGWKNQWQSPRFRDYFDSLAGFSKSDWHYIQAQKDFKTEWENLGYQENFYDLEEEIAVFCDAGEGNPRMDLLHHIRNAIAHGRFTAKTIHKQKDYYIIMEDVKKENRFYRVNARIILKKSTLLKWINFFECKDDEAKKLCQDLLQKSAENGKQRTKSTSRNSNQAKKN